MKKIFCFLICLLPIVSWAQSGKLFTVDKELSNSNINCLYQDRHGMVWIATDDGLNMYDGAKFTIYKHIKNNTNSLSDNNIRVINEDRKGNIIIGTLKGLQIYNSANGQFIKAPLLNDKGSDMNPHITCILKRHNGELMIATSGHRLCNLIYKNNRPILTLANVNVPSDFLNYVYEDTHGNLWVSSEDKGFLFINKRGKDKHYFLNNGEMNDGLTGMCTDNKGNLYASSSKTGLYIYDKKSDKFINIKSKLFNNIPINFIFPTGNQIVMGTMGLGLKIYDIKSGQIKNSRMKFTNFNFDSSDIKSLLKDRMGNIWMGNNGKGVLLIPNKSSQFQYIGYKSLTNNIIGSNSVQAVCKDYEGTVWLGTANDGIYSINKAGASHHFTPKDGDSSIPLYISGIYEDSNHTLWLYSQVSGLLKMDKRTGHCTSVVLTYKGDEIKAVTAIAEDKYKRLWIGIMGGGVSFIDLRTGKVTACRTIKNGHSYSPQTDALHNRWVSTLCCTSNDKLYIGSYDGLGCMDLKTMCFTSTFKKNRLFPGDIIYTICEGAKGHIWIGTANGLIHLNEKTIKSYTYTMADGLPSDVINSIQRDKHNNLWIGTDYGISHFIPRTRKFTNYYSGDGLQGNEFNVEASFADKSGTLYFGSTSGISYFNPDNIKAAAHKPDLKLVGFYINNELVKAGEEYDGRVVTDNAVIESDQFSLSHNSNTFTLEFSTMDFYNSERISYTYSINGGPWIKLRAGVCRVTFSDMKPGTYHFRVKSQDYDSYSDVKTITVVIHPAWYASIWAKMFYLILFVVVIRIAYIYMRKRREARQKMLEREQAEQINEAKLQFFINISHEIRTPMSLIISPLQQLISSDHDSGRQKTYNIINRNAERILRLVNQLMDIRKIDKGQMSLTFSKTNVIGVIDSICGDFGQLAHLKKISFDFNHNMDSLDLWIDHANFDKIIVNILSNAFKFTPENGNISISVSASDMAEIVISNSGPAINENEIEKIFGRFYQIRNSVNNSNIGTGIGLHLTRSLVELHHGNIHAENNTDGPGCKFIIRLPLGKDHLHADEIEEAVVEEPKIMDNLVSEIPIEEKKRTRSTNHYVLVVEDDEEIRKYVCEQLRPEFHTKECVNGKEAYNMILTKKPDLVISDVMMPEMDGFALCRKIRQNPNINSIPIILLTAKTTAEDNIEGLDRGADAYVTKPFNMDVLRKTVENLINSREQLRNAYTGKQEQKDKITDLEAKSPDDKLMERIMKVIDSNISNPDLSIEMITQEVGISRVHLYRKMKELTNQSMRDFIRNIRLKQAAKLLSEKKHSITEVVEMTGFSRISNFSTLFKDMYGMSPMAYRDQKKEKDDSAEEINTVEE